MAIPVTYSFLRVKASIVGPNGAFTIGSDAGVAEEGITVEYAEDQDTMTIGADGFGMHTLHAGQSGSFLIRLVKASPVNNQLDGMYLLDRANPAAFGQNTIVVSWLDAGDVITGTRCAFRKFPNVVYAKAGPMLEWAFNAIFINALLGAGV